MRVKNQEALRAVRLAFFSKFSARFHLGPLLQSQEKLP